MSIKLKFILSVITSIIALTLMFSGVAYYLFSQEIDRQSTFVFGKELENLVRSAHDQDDLLFEGKYADPEEPREQIKDAMRNIYRRQLYGGANYSLVDLHDKAYPFIVSMAKKIIAHPQETLQIEEVLLPPHVWFQITQSESAQGEFHYVHDNVERWAIYHRYPEWQWIFIYSVPTQVKNQTIYTYLRLQLLIALALVALFSLLAYLHIRHILKPLDRIVDHAKQIAAGHIVHITPASSTKHQQHNEFNLLAETFNSMVSALQTKVNTIAEIARGNLSVPYRVENEQDVLGQVIVQMKENLQDISHHAQKVAEGNYQDSLSPKSSQDLLSTSLNKMTHALAVAQDEMESRVRQRTQELEHINQTIEQQNREQGYLQHLNEQLQGEQSITTVAQNILNSLATILQCQVGVLYIRKDNAHLYRAADYALAQRDDAPRKVACQQGMIGQVACNQIPMWIEDAPVYTRILLAADCIPPSALLYYPLVLNQQTIAVLELGFAKKVVQKECAAWLKRAERTMTVAIRLALDTEERQRNQAELLAAKEKAEEVTEAKSIFLANMSHEIRTPMNAIIGMAHLALHTDLTPQQADYLNKIFSSANALLGILNDILDFSKIEAGQLDIESIPFDLEDVMRQLADVLVTRANEKQLELLFSIDKDVPHGLKGDPLRLTQVLLNLGNNAIKFTENGEIIIHIKTILRQNDQVTLEFSVQDTGIGMSQEQCDRLFQAFSQADISTTRKYGGTGLGLSICKRLVELMGGTIGVNSKQGVGSTFYFTLTLQESALANVTQPDLNVLDRIRVLVIDDSVNSREILCALLTSLTLEVETADTPQQSVQLLTQENAAKYDLVFVDWMMPEINGIELIKRIQSQLATEKQPKFIIVTGYDGPEVVEQAQELSVNNVLIKPVSRSQLFDVCVHALDKKPLTQQQYVEQQPIDLGLSGTDNLKDARILLVEDNEINQQIAVELLRKAGVVVDVADNGQIALEKLAKQDYDGILMDIQMPIMDGYETTKILRSQKRYQHLPIIAMTANAMVADQEKSRQIGMNDHLSKPINPNKMFQVITKWVTPKVGQTVVQPQPMATLTQVAAETAPEDDTLIWQQLKMLGLNTEKGLLNVGNQPVLYKKLLNDFHQHYFDLPQQLLDCLHAHDHAKAQRLVHTVKGLTATLGMPTLHEILQVLERHLHMADDEATKQQILQFEPPLGEIINGLQQCLATKPAEVATKVDDVVENETQFAQSAEITVSEPQKQLLQQLKVYLENADGGVETWLHEHSETLQSCFSAQQWRQLLTLITDFEFEQALQNIRHLLPESE